MCDCCWKAKRLTFFCVTLCLQPHSQALLLLCDQRTPAEQPQVRLLGGVHCKSLLSLSVMGQELIIPSIYLSLNPKSTSGCPSVCCWWDDSCPFVLLGSSGAGEPHADLSGRRSIWRGAKSPACLTLLFRLNFPPDSSYLKTVFLLLAWQKEDLVVTLLPAGHCPGSVMWVQLVLSTSRFHATSSHLQWDGRMGV